MRHPAPPAPQRPSAGELLAGEVRVGVYVRRSTDDEHQPYSIQAQDTRLTAYIGSQPGWRQAARFADDASGATTTRPGLQRALAAAQAGLIDVLLVYRVDRLTRSLRDLVTLLDDLDHARAAFRSATEPFDTATAMGRMLVQMLGMFAQFERDTIIDRVIAGMERKAAAGKWKGGRRPYCYHVNPATHLLVPDDGEAAIIRLIYQLYSRDRLGTRAIAAMLNSRGHRTTSGGTWSGHQVLRVLSNRAYLSELTFRGITTTATHAPVIDKAVFKEAQRILAARGQDYSKRAASGSDYLLTGLMRCPSCGKAMIGTRAHGRTKVYRYYTCFTRARYDTKRCNAARLDADAAEHAILTSLAGFYRDQHALIAEAITQAQNDQTESQRASQDQLTAVTRELARTTTATDRYLAAFEAGTLDPEDLAGRLAQLKTRTRQLAARRDQLAASLAAVPVPPPPATLRQVADHIDSVIGTGTDNERKTLIEALVARVKITSPGSLIPVYRIPQQPHAAETRPDSPEPDSGTTTAAVRAITNLVGRLGLEPRTHGLKVRCSTIELTPREN
jgi:site-specific DNA recombinase